MMSVDDRVEQLRRFLRERRARIKPADVGLPATARRRVTGLRREEVAALAGIGLTWYTALEQGDAGGVSEAALYAVADALRLSAPERQHLLGDIVVAETGTAFFGVAQTRLPKGVLFIGQALWGSPQKSRACRRGRCSGRCSSCMSLSTKLRAMRPRLGSSKGIS